MPVKEELLEKVVERLREQQPREQSERVERFVRRYYSWASREDLGRRSPVDLYGMAVAHYNLARRRQSGTATVRVYNPRFEEHGWQSTHTAIEIVGDDMPFLVDSVSMEINRRGYETQFMIHPIVNVRRDGRGHLTDLAPADEHDEAALSESFIHVEVTRRTEPEALRELERSLERVLGEVRAAVEDWNPMRERMNGIVSEFEGSPPPVAADELAETESFLSWVEDHHFTFLGYREYELKTEEGEDVLRPVSDTGLGILREEKSRPVSRSFSRLPPEVRRLARARHLLNLTKANTHSTVHRPAYLDYIGVKKFDENGDVVGERRFLGLYTSTAYNTKPQEIPLIRAKIQKTLARAGFPANSHYEKALLEVFETFPRDQLLQISEDELYEISMGIVYLQERQRVRLFIRRDTYGRFLSCLVYLPRERHDTETRRRIQDLLQREFNGESVEFSVHLSESVLARLHFIIYTDPSEPREYDVSEVEARLVELVREWTDTLSGSLVERYGEERGNELLNRYRDAFPPGYRDESLARTAVGDIGRMETLESDEDLGMSLYHPLEAPEEFLRFRLYRRGAPLSLSEVMPLLEDMGVEVVDQRPHRIEPAGTEPVWIHDFGLVHRSDGGGRVEDVREVFQESFDRMWRGAVESDGFNRLVLAAGLTWREITVLRAYCKYLRQAETTFSQDYMEDTLSANPHIARLLVQLFEARFDPQRQPDTERETERLKSRVEEALEEVVSLDEDRILRSFLDMTLATLRTNYFQTDESGQSLEYLSFKLDPASIPDLPRPRPMFEIFVYSPRTEGVHLRGGKVARGGIRWSDRREDFRTEVLGLMKAQMVKNAVIVPVGAKGGFVVKRPPANASGDREALQAEVVRCYRTLICGMLDLTDNLVAGEPVPPPEVVRYDGDDPYLVVAADKGTATFSDIANGISGEYGFWLGDAFASGGSAGYDHKKMGITARGAWESVRRHFRELGRDIQSEEFTVVGVGDMSGDVFGNGMLLSRHIRLVGAFNHQHIFVDPDPDPETSYAERERLFARPRSSWKDYDGGLISEGGGIFPRTAKSIKLTPQMKELLGVDEDRLAPNDLISGLLKAEVDLLWNGGIGTYVKASAETHAAVGDRTNDALRIDAAELRCRVVGEGGNLGLTQRARIEYALGGGRLYMDAVDNSAGVDCSDHEVNIKVLLNSIVADGEMTGKQRDRLLEEMTGEVAGLVLHHNYRQTQALSTAVAQANQMADVHARYLRSLENAGRIDRALDSLPTEEELSDRKSRGLGLTAPEFSVLLSHTKLALYEGLLASEVPEDPYLAVELQRYFPTPLQERFREEMQRHRLRREITATHAVNSMVNRAGTTFAYRMSEETGADVPEIARAYAVAREVFGLRELWSEVEGLDNAVSSDTQTRMMLEARKLLERATRWLLRNRRPPLDISATITYFTGESLEQPLIVNVPEYMPGADREALERKVSELIEANVPQELARRLAALGAGFSALDITDISAATGEPVESAAGVYFNLGGTLRLHWLRDHIEALPRDNRWRALSRAALRDDLYNLQAELTAEVLRSAPADLPATERIATWLSGNRRAVERAQQVMADIGASGSFDLATLSVALREGRNLITASSAIPTRDQIEAATH